MKTAIVRSWEMALDSLGYDEVSRKVGPDAPTLAGVIISGAGSGDARPNQSSLPLGCIFAVRYSSR